MYYFSPQSSTINGSKQCGLKRACFLKATEWDQMFGQQLLSCLFPLRILSKDLQKGDIGLAGTHVANFWFVKW